MVREIDLEQIRMTAERYYCEGEFYCSEAIVKTLIDAFEIDITDDVIKMASGFPVGIGGMGCICGAISGGVMVIGLLFGRKNAKDPAVDKAMSLSGKIHSEFEKTHKTTCCRGLTKGMTKGSEEHIRQCAAFTGEIAYETAYVIANELQVAVKQ
ncbi:MAG: C-GCAxxG-C-C family (seleno)protein [Eubacteriaceae bacterium]